MLRGIDSSRRIRVRGREGEEIEWSRAAAVRSGRLSYWLNDIESPEDDVFPIPNVSSAVLREIGVMCEADWSAERLDGCSLAELATIVEGAIILDAELALGYAQAAFAKRLDGKRANELRLLFGAVDDFERDAGPRTRARAQRARDERVEALAEPAFTPDNSTLQYTTITIAALDVNDDVAGVALAKVSVCTLIELKDVSRAWCALGRRVLCSKLCRGGDQAYPRQLDEITELNLELLIEAGRPWEAVRAGRLLPNLRWFTGYGCRVDVAAVRLVSLDSDGANDDEGEEAEEEEEEEVEGEGKEEVIYSDEELFPRRVLALAKRALWGCVASATHDGRGDGRGDPPRMLLLGAIAGAGSGEICQIPVEELRNDMLQELDLNDPWRGYEIGPEGALLVACFIPCSRVMTTLSLYQNQIGDAGAKAIAEALKVKPSLTRLDLGANRIGSEGARAIADALKTDAGVVEVLWLIENNIGDDGAEAFADALKSSTTKLTTLNLNSNRITNSGASAFAGVFRVGRTRLTMLGLWDNAMDAAGERVVRDALASWDGIELEISCQGD